MAFNYASHYAVGIAWEENDYIVSGTSVVNVCVFVYSTLSLREVIIIMDIIPEGGINVL